MCICVCTRVHTHTHVLTTESPSRDWKMLDLERTSSGAFCPMTHFMESGQASRGAYLLCLCWPSTQGCPLCSSINLSFSWLLSRLSLSCCFHVCWLPAARLCVCSAPSWRCLGSVGWAEPPELLHSAITSPIPRAMPLRQWPGLQQRDREKAMCVGKIQEVKFF